MDGPHGKESASSTLAVLGYSVTNMLLRTSILTGHVGGICFPRGQPAVLFFPCSFPPIVFLSFFGIASIGLSCLVALFLYHVVFGIQYLGILNGVAAFVIVGIGKHVLTQNLLILPCHNSCLQERER